MKIKLNSVLVSDQDRALEVYTESLGFLKKEDIPMGEFRWLTVVSPDGPQDLELVLEPTANPAAKTYQQALYDSGVPLTALESDDIHEECQRMKDKGIVFRMEPTEMGGATLAVFDDTCGNLIQIYQV